MLFAEGRYRNPLLNTVNDIYYQAHKKSLLLLAYHNKKVTWNELKGIGLICTVKSFYFRSRLCVEGIKQQTVR